MTFVPMRFRMLGMRHKACYSLVFLCTALLLVFWLWQSTNPHQSPDPIYRGKKLSEWLIAYASSVDSHSPEIAVRATEAREAILQIGTNGLTLLIEMISSEDTAFGRWLAQQVPGRLALAVRFGDAADRRGIANYGFSVLGEHAAPAIPRLKKLLTNPNSGVRAAALETLVCCVGASSQETMPEILRLMNDPDRTVQRAAVAAFERMTNR